jgi:hypothetical protein
VVVLLVVLQKYIHTTHTLFPKGWQGHLRYSSETATFYLNELVVINTAECRLDRKTDIETFKEKKEDFETSVSENDSLKCYKKLRKLL